MAIVLPDGILTNSSLQYVRDFIMEKTQILAVVSLPQFTFSHYGAGVKSSLVFVRKKGEKEKLGRYKIFMAIAEHIGYDATGRRDPQNELATVYEEYRKFDDKK
jgi:type I restriction enzyme M protein